MSRPTFLPWAFSNISQHHMCDKGCIKFSQQNWFCLQMLKKQILTAYIHRDIPVSADFSLVHWLHARTEFIDKIFVYTMGVQEGNLGQTQQNLAETSPVLFLPHLFMAYRTGKLLDSNQSSSIIQEMQKQKCCGKIQRSISFSCTWI